MAQENEKELLEFRISRSSSVHAKLSEALIELRPLIQRNDPAAIRIFIVKYSDEIARTMLQAQPQYKIIRDTRSAIVHGLGYTIWKSPENPQQVENDIIDKLAKKFVGDKPDYARLAKGLYMLVIMVHKYSNANGRTARALYLLFTKALGEESISQDEIDEVLGTEERPWDYVRPDKNRFFTGLSVFAQQKGLPPTEIQSLLYRSPDDEFFKTFPKYPEEDVLRHLSARLGVPVEKLREEFIRFLVLDSDLSWF